MGAVPNRLLAQDSKDFGFGSRQFDIFANAEQDRSGRSPFLNYQGVPLALDAVKKLPEFGAGSQCGDDD